jgi:hypothetical protein
MAGTQGRPSLAQAEVLVFLHGWSIRCHLLPGTPRVMPSGGPEATTQQVCVFGVGGGVEATTVLCIIFPMSYGDQKGYHSRAFTPQKQVPWSVKAYPQQLYVK